MIEINGGGQSLSVARPIVTNHIRETKPSIGKGLQPLGVSEDVRDKTKNNEDFNLSQ